MNLQNTDILTVVKFRIVAFFCVQKLLVPKW